MARHRLTTLKPTSPEGERNEPTTKAEVVG